MPAIAVSHRDHTSTASILTIAAGRPLRPVVFIMVLGGLTALGPFTMDLYLPAFPLIETDLHTTTTMVQLTLTATAIGLGIGQLVVGPWSDSIGRKVPVASATGLHIASSVVIAIAPSIEIVALARFGQGFGAAAGAVVAAAMIRDLFGGKRLVRMAARIALISGLAPIVAPIIGSQLLLFTDWRGVFWLLAGFGVLVLTAVVIVLPETLRHTVRGGAQRRWTDRIAVLARDRVYLGAVLVGAMVFAAIVSYLSASPFIFQDGYGFSEQTFGLVFAVNAVGLLVATQVSARLMRRFRPASLLCVALPALVLSGAGFVAVGLFDGGSWWALAASLLLVAIHGFCGPCLNVLILARHQQQSGTAVALAGFVNSVVGGILSLIPALLGGVSALSLGVVVAGSGVLGLVALLIVVRPSSVPELTAD
jgi:DHA1 family bicyclomycin/chloramphenicol resistance-like MFS transporter